MARRIGFISFRFAGTDGVTLESLKLVKVFSDLGYDSFFCSGESTMPEEVSMIFPEMHFSHPHIMAITSQCFGELYRLPEITAELHNLRRVIKKQLYTFINEFSIDVLVLQNVLAIPMNIPFSMALVEVIAETRIPAIAHHHDFYWERERFNVTCVQDILTGCFPPDLPNMQHMVINSLAQKQLSYRHGVSSIIVPNVMDYAHPPRGRDSYNEIIRQDLGIDEDMLLVLQPTRIVQRKGIERTIEIIHRLEQKALMLISHESGDEGSEYKKRVLEYADMLHVEIKMIAERVGEVRGLTEDGLKVYDLNDIYSCADVVCYPSILEGFGNALLETYYFQKPIVINLYPVYATDIRPKGFSGIEFQDFISEKTVNDLTSLLQSPEQVGAMVSRNYELAAKYFSFERLSHIISRIVKDFFGV